MSEDLQAALAPCEAKEGDLHDWCAVQVLEATEPSGAERYTVCRRLDDKSAEDWCLDSASRGKEPFSPDDTCDGVRSDQLRYSCQIAVADRISQSGTLEQAVAACKPTGDLIRFCLYHIPVHRKEAYTEADGLEKLTKDMKYLVEQVPEAGEMTDVGFGVARTIIDMGKRNTEPCMAFPMGRAQQACVRAVESGDFNVSMPGSSGAMPAAPSMGQRPSGGSR